jgi:hypothetical protein
MFRKSLAKYIAMSILSLACIGSTLGQAASGDDFKAQSAITTTSPLSSMQLLGSSNGSGS